MNYYRNIINLFKKEQFNNNSYYNTIDLCIIRYSQSHNFYIPAEIRKMIKEYTYKEINDENINSAVKLWLYNEEQALILYGHISHWNTSKVTDMKYMFSNEKLFNQPIGDWDVSQVTSMKSMLHNAKLFNQNIGEWDVTNMESMFFNAISFNQPIGEWNVSNVTNMMYMFYNAVSFNQCINKWNFTDITCVCNMFYSAKSFKKKCQKKMVVV